MQNLLKMRTINLSSSETEKLNYERYYYPYPIVQKRIHAVYLKATLSKSDKEIGRIVDLHRNVVAYWTKIYIEHGFDALCKIEYCNKNKSQLELFSDSIVSSFEKNPPFKVSEAMSRIEKMTGIKRGLSQIRNFLRRNGFRCRKMGHIPAKADPQNQHDWVENTLTPVIAKAKKNECHLLFMDASHFILQPFISRVWSKVRLFIKASAGRNRINVLGALNAVSKEVSTLINQTYITAETIVTFLHQLKEQYQNAPIFIVLDNARYQHCNLVQKTAESLGITLLFLPPYSPNLNIIERLWKFTKEEVLYGKYYDCPQKFHQAIKSFFEIVNQKYQTKLSSLLTLNFQSFDEKNALNLAA